MRKKPFVGVLLQKLAAEAGVEVIVEPRYGYVGQVIGSDGRKHYFRNTCFDLNPLGAVEIAKDKDYANFFMKRMGYPIIPGQTFFSERRCKAIGSVKNIDAAYRYARRLGFPVVIKPNSKSQGSCVSKVSTKKEFYQAARRALGVDPVIIVQRFVTGKDYRIVVLDGRIISAYQRIPLSVRGDGKLTIAELLHEKQKRFDISGRDTIIDLDDFRIKARLKRLKLSMESVLGINELLFLLDNANLSSGGDALDATKIMHPGWKEIAVKLTEDMGLRYCGVDLMIPGEINEKPKKYWVIEINGAPGIDNYSASGSEQEKIVETLYTEVLRAIAALNHNDKRP